MSITKEEFKEARPGDIFRDTRKRSWTVIEALPKLPFPTLRVKSPDGQEIKISWLGVKIVNEQFKPIGELDINIASLISQKKSFFKKT